MGEFRFLIFHGTWNISRSIYNPLRSRPLFARYRTKISAALRNFASCMKNLLPGAFPGAFPPETDIGHVSSFRVKLTRSHENASRQIRPRLEAPYYWIMRWTTSGQRTSLNYAACKLKRLWRRSAFSKKNNSCLAHISTDEISTDSLAFNSRQQRETKREKCQENEALQVNFILIKGWMNLLYLVPKFKITNSDTLLYF